MKTALFASILIAFGFSTAAYAQGQHQRLDPRQLFGEIVQEDMKMSDYLKTLIDRYEQAFGKSLSIGQNNDTITAPNILRRFLAADTNADAKLDAEEIARLAGSTPQVTKFIVGADNDGDGYVDLKEIYAAVGELDNDESANLRASFGSRPMPVEAILQMASNYFRNMDRNGDGIIDAAELHGIHHMHHQLRGRNVPIGMPTPSISGNAPKRHPNF